MSDVDFVIDVNYVYPVDYGGQEEVVSTSEYSLSNLGDGLVRGRGRDHLGQSRSDIIALSVEFPRREHGQDPHRWAGNCSEIPYSSIWFIK